MKSIEQQRSNVFERLQTSTLEVLGRPEIIDALGESVVAITAGVENTYCLNKVDGRLAYKYDPNIGKIAVYSLLASDMCDPRGFEDEWYDMDHNITLGSGKDEDEKLDFKRRQLNKPQTQTTYANYQDEEGVYYTTHQPVIIIPSAIAKKPAEVVSVVMSHEINHALRVCELTDSYVERFLSSIVNGDLESDSNESLRTDLERTAYPITYNMARVLATDPIPPDYFKQIIGDNDPSTAGLAVKEESEKIKLSAETDLTSLLALSLGAVSFSSAFGSPETGSLPSEAEVLAYQAAGLFH